MNNQNNLPKCPPSCKTFKSQGDYANIRPRVKPAPEGDWDDDLDPEDRARLMGRDFMGPKWK